MTFLSVSFPDGREQVTKTPPAAQPPSAVEPIIRLISLTKADMLQNATNLPGSSNRDR